MAFNREDTQTKIIAIIAEKLNISQDGIKPESTLKELGADSLDIVEIIMNIEETFRIEINDTDAEKIKNVSQVVDLVHAIRAK